MDAPLTFETGAATHTGHGAQAQRGRLSGAARYRRLGGRRRHGRPRCRPRRQRRPSSARCNRSAIRPRRPTSSPASRTGSAAPTPDCRRSRAPAAARQIGATIAALLAFDSYYACVWSGDSRVYLVRAGEIAPAVARSQAAQELVDKGTLSREEARKLARPQRRHAGHRRRTTTGAGDRARRRCRPATCS